MDSFDSSHNITCGHRIRLNYLSHKYRQRSLDVKDERYNETGSETRGANLCKQEPNPQHINSLIGAGAILAELKALHSRLMPSLHTIERLLQRNGITLPKVRLARCLPRQISPGPQVHESNQLHQVDFVGPPRQADPLLHTTMGDQ